jgi:hypothetical protein
MSIPKKKVKVSQFSAGTENQQEPRIVAIVKELETTCDKSSKVVGLSLHEFQGSKELAFVLIPIEMWNLARAGGGIIPVNLVVKGSDETRSSYYERIGEKGFERDNEVESDESDE